EERIISHLGIDVGGTKVALRAEGDQGSAVEQIFRWPEAGDVRGDLAVLAEGVTALLAGWPEPVGAVGVALPATCDAAGTVTVWPGRPSWVGLDLATALGELFPGVPVGWADDGDLAALAEADAA